MAGFWAPLVALFDGMVEAGFLKPQNRRLVVHHDEIATLLDRLRAFEPAPAEKWITPDER